MTLESLIVLLIVGAIAGWLAGLIWKGGGFGLLWNIIIGIAGAFIGGLVFGILGIYFHGIIGSIIAAISGALILLAVINQIKRRR